MYGEEDEKHLRWINEILLCMESRKFRTKRAVRTPDQMPGAKLHRRTDTEKKLRADAEILRDVSDGCGNDI